jgi:fermentation-respiration switch protein FrsA (DUF1100 family)
VQWDGATRTVTVTRNDVTLMVRIGEDKATLNGQAVPVGEKVVLTPEGRTVVPLAFLNGALGVQVAWQEGAPVVDQLGTKALDFVKALTAGTTDRKQFTADFSAVMPDARLAAIAAQLKSFGPLQKLSVTGKSTNAVHQNVSLVAGYAQVPLNVTIRFSPQGLVDDYFMAPYSLPVPVAGAPAYADPKAFTEQEVVVGEGTHFPLPGTLTMPVGAGPFPAVVLVHGSGPQDRDESIGGVKVFRDLAQGLASRGIAVLRYEKRTLEQSRKFDINPFFGVQDETVIDALTAVKLVSTLDRIDAKRIYVLGHSQGAGLVPQMIAQDTEKLIKGGIMAAAADSFLDAILAQNKLAVAAKMVPEAQIPFIEAQIAMVRDPAFSVTNVPKGFMLGAPQYYLDLRDPVGPLAAKQTTPLFIFQGARDMQVPVEQLDMWKQDLAGRTNVAFQLYPKLNHIFTEGEGQYGFPDEYNKPANVAQYVVEDIAAWINKH